MSDSCGNSRKTWLIRPNFGTASTPQLNQPSNYNITTFNYNNKSFQILKYIVGGKAGLISLLKSSVTKQYTADPWYEIRGAISPILCGISGLELPPVFPILLESTLSEYCESCWVSFQGCVLPVVRIPRYTAVEALYKNTRSTHI